MALIDNTYFFGNLTIAQKSDTSVSSSLTWLIDDLEPRLLTDLLGYALYKSYTAGVGTTQKYTDIRDGKEYTNRSGVLTKWVGLKFTNGTAKKSLIANYVYWHWMYKESSVNTGTGEKKPASKNAKDTSAVHKMVAAWNEMVKWNKDLVEFLLTNETDYPEFTEHYARIPIGLLKPQNVLGI